MHVVLTRTAFGRSVTAIGQDQRAAGLAGVPIEIAVVVIGGTSVAGGFGNVPGLWGAFLCLFLLAAMLDTFGVGEGVRQILTGLIVILVIVAASFRRSSG
jgi:ribose transport system permease protein